MKLRLDAMARREQETDEVAKGSRRSGRVHVSLSTSMIGASTTESALLCNRRAHAHPQAAMRTLMGTELLALRSDEFDKRGWNSEALLLQAAPAKLMSECFAGCVSGSWRNPCSTLATSRRMAPVTPAAVHTLRSGYAESAGRSTPTCNRNRGARRLQAY